MKSIIAGLGSLALILIATGLFIPVEAMAASPVNDFKTGFNSEIRLDLIQGVPNMKADMKILITTFDDIENVSVTAYNDGTGLIREIRSMDIPAGIIELSYMDVASEIDPTSVHFISRTDPGSLEILEQNYQYDLVSIDELFRRHIDMNVRVKTKDGNEIEGTLLVYEDVPVIKTPEGIRIINKPSEVSFKELPDGLITRPTLKWLIDSRSSGQRSCEMSYLTSGLKWEANYIAIVSGDESTMNLAGWITIDNTSGVSFHNAVLKLIAGEIHRNEVRSSFELDAFNEGNHRPVLCEMSPQFEEESFFEYHLYTLQRPVTVLNREQKQVQLIDRSDIRSEKSYRISIPPLPAYYHNSQQWKVNVVLNFRNDQESGMGIPLPKGKVRVYQKDSSDALQFAGEDLIEHTPKDEEISIIVGEAFDITCDRTVVENNRIRNPFNKYQYESTISVIIRNHKNVDVEVEYIDKIMGFWAILKSSIDSAEKTANSVTYNVPVSANNETELVYTIRMGW